jgi:CheY-like chemotaxis protein
MKTLQILVADDHELIRAGLKTQLEEHADWKVCGEADDGRAAVELAGKLKPDVVVLDISMPELNGIEAARQIRKACPKTEILILTMRARCRRARVHFENRRDTPARFRGGSARAAQTVSDRQSFRPRARRLSRSRSRREGN